MKDLGAVFEQEFLERLKTLRENPNANAVLKLELHRIRVAARSADETALERDLTLLEQALNESPGAFRSLEIATQNPKSLQLLEILGLNAVPLEVDAQFLEAFQLEFETRRSSLQTLILSWRANPNDANILNQAKLETHRLRVAARAIQHPLETLLERLENLLDKTDLQGFESLLETRVSDDVSQSLLEALKTIPSSSKPVAAVKPNSTDSVRVNVQRLDTLLAQSGELTITRIRLETRTKNVVNLLTQLQLARKNWRFARVLRNRLASNVQHPDLQQFLGFFDRNEDKYYQMIGHLEQLVADLTQDTAQLRSVNTIIENEVLGVRLLPASNLFPNLERLVRDLSQTLGKRAKFETYGGEIGMDRKILDGLRDPLMHMVRNALDHGLETPETRKTAGKPEMGTIKLEVRQSGSSIEITLSDDGAGINTERVRQVAQKKGLIAELTVLDQENTLELLFAPGFSTATTISQTSGRGVGMDVVRENVRALNGSISLQSQTGRGSSFHLLLPATLATSRVLVVQVTDSQLAIPTSVIERVARVRASELVNHEGQEVVILDGHAIRVIELSKLLEIPTHQALKPDGWRTFVNIASQNKRLCLIVDALLGEQEIVVKKLGYPLEQIVHLQGAAVLDTGMLVPILNTDTIIQKGLSQRFSSNPNTLTLKPKTRILVVDDSITTRSLERTILENAGFETRVAINGLEALEILRTDAIQLVLSDVEMPLMDGFALTKEIRGIERFKHLPVILVTSLNTPEYQQRGAEAGADAYIIKSEFDQNVLLETVARLL
jgi:two-component system, chemotaxis family, sensor kinase CheA